MPLAGLPHNRGQEEGAWGTLVARTEIYLDKFKYEEDGGLQGTSWTPRKSRAIRPQEEWEPAAVTLGEGCGREKRQKHLEGCACTGND